MVSSVQFRPATRKKSKLRMAIDGVSGSGKTFTGLRFATALGSKIAVINSESGAVEKYLGLAPDGTPWEFDVCELPDFSPTSYTAAILAAGRAGYDVLLIDSLSHAWIAALELVDKKTQESRSKNAFTAGWRDVTPLHNQLVEAILHSPCHIIATMRAKTEYVIERDERGTSTPRKVGLEAVQRSGMEYEFDVYARIDCDHVLRVSKSRCPEIDGAVVVKPTASFMEPVSKWLNEGSAVSPDFFAVTEEDLRKFEKREEAKQQAIEQDAPKKSAIEIMREKRQAEETPEPAKVESSATATNATPNEAECSMEQRTKILVLVDKIWDESERVESLNKILKKRKVGALHGLTRAQADEIIEKLQSTADSIAEQSQNEPVNNGSPSTTTSEPCTQVQIDRAKALLQEMEQTAPGSTAKFVELLKASGRQRIADFTGLECEDVIRALAVKNFEKYLTETLVKRDGGEIPF